MSLLGNGKQGQRNQIDMTDANVKELLQEIHTITEKSELAAAGREYNIFRVLECDGKEVLMCRMLADLLNPHGQHGRGSVYLEKFLEEVLHETDADQLSASASIYKEYSIDAERRIDLVIAGNGRFLPIEVKIHAGEQQAQCYDYYQYAVRHDPDTRMIYLTLYGNEPSEYSRTSGNGAHVLDLSHIQTISFQEDIAGWLQKLEHDEHDPVMLTMIRQYRQAIYSVTGYWKEKQRMDLLNILMGSEDNFRSMLFISEMAERTKAKLIYEVLAEFEKEMDGIISKYGLVRENRFHWYEYQEKATETYYHQSESTYPGINYVIPGIQLPEGAELWLRIEIEYNLFFGFCLFDTSAESEFGKGNQLDEASEQVKKILSAKIDTSAAQYDAWWVQWWYLPTGEKEYGVGKEEIPNFRSMNEAAVRLSDPKKREDFVMKSVQVIDWKLDWILKNRRYDGNQEK